MIHLEVEPKLRCRVKCLRQKPCSIRTGGINNQTGARSLPSVYTKDTSINSQMVTWSTLILWICVIFVNVDAEVFTNVLAYGTNYRKGKENTEIQLLILEQICMICALS